MGGTPLAALAILVWPLNKLPAEIAQKVLDGATEACSEAGIKLSGGHSIEASDPIFGLAVTGTIDLVNLKRNNGAKSPAELYLSKPIGIGIMATAQKNGLLLPKHEEEIIKLMCKPNSLGQLISKEKVVSSMTDVTGFGLLGHLLEICKASGVNAQLDLQAIPLIDGLADYCQKGQFPGGAINNWKSIFKDVAQVDPMIAKIFCDPQTSGGLLIAIDEGQSDTVLQIAKTHGTSLTKIGKLTPRNSAEEKYITFKI